MEKDLEFPLVSVLMPVYNGELYLEEAIESILNQSYTHFEFIIINDGSTDNSAQIIFSFSDSRIKYHSNESNIGLVKTLNIGIDLCKGEYVARMDQDDISYTDRLETQILHLEKNKQIGFIGSWINVIPENRMVKFPSSHEEIHAQIHFQNPFAHPTIIFRKELLNTLDEKYNTDFKNIEDYELWSRLIKMTEAVNYPKVLLDYRKHPNQMSRVGKLDAIRSSVEIKLKLIHKLNAMNASSFSAVWMKIISGINEITVDEFQLFQKAYSSINKCDLISLRIEPVAFEKCLQKIILQIIIIKIKNFEFYFLYKYFISPQGLCSFLFIVNGLLYKAKMKLS